MRLEPNTIIGLLNSGLLIYLIHDTRENRKITRSVEKRLVNMDKALLHKPRVKQEDKT